MNILFLSVATAAAVLFALWRRAEAARSRERLAKDTRFRSLLEETNEGVVAESGGQIVYSNPAFRRLFQRHEGELLGKPLHLLFAHESRERLMEVRTALLDADPVPESYEAVAQTPGGARFDVEIRAGMVSFDGREAMQMSLRDITRRKRAEVRLSRSEERYRSLFERSLAGVYRSDLAGKLLDCNDAFARILGFNYREEALGVPLTSHDFDPGDRARLTARLLAEKSLTNIEVRLRRKDGEPVWVLKNEALARAEDGSHSVLEGTIVDISDRQRAAQAIRESEERFRRLAEATFEGIAITENGRVLETNPQFARMFGYEAEEIVGMSELELVAPEHHNQVAEAMRTGYEKPYEMVCLRKDGTVFPAEASGRKFPYEGRTVRVTAVQDITSRRLAEEDYRRYFTYSLDLLCTAGFDGYFKSLNPVWEKTFGFTTEELLSTPYMELIHPEDRAATRGELQKLATGGLTVGFEHRFRCKDGTYRWLALNATPLPRESLIYATARDLTERKRAEEALRQSEERYRDIFEFAPVGIYQSLPDGSLLTANATLVTMLGHGSVEELLLRNLNDIYFNPADRQALIARYESVGANRSLAVRWKRKDGTPLWVELDVHVLKDEEGRVRNYEGFVHNITERVAAEEEKRYLQEQLSQSQKIEAVGQLAGGIAHDFNNLLTAIGGYSELLVGELSSADPRRVHAEEIRKAGDRAASLTRQLLAFSRRQVLEPRVLDLNAIVLDLDKILRRLIGEQIQLRTRPLDGLWPVKADPGQIEQAILNLAINARDAMPEGGTLTIETANVELGGEYLLPHASAMPGPYAMVAVSDTGTGMNEEVKAQIFEPFFTTKEQGKGTGLGLSTTYGIVKQSGGYIWCYSEPGCGATFKIYLPRVQEGIEKASAPQAVPSPRAGEETILLVEDEPEVRSLVQKVLKMQGYTVLVAANAEEALTRSQEFQGEIAIMVSDVVMPGISGKQLADRLTASRPETKVLFMSGYTDDAIVHHGILDPGVAFLQKPFTPKGLTDKVREVLDATPKEFKVS